MTDYTPTDWYWVIAENGKIYSSKQSAYVDSIPADSGSTNIPTLADLEWVLVNAGLSPIIPIIPTSVSMRQARLQLSVLGSYSTVNAAVSTMGEQAQIEWEYATTVDRGNSLTAAMVQLLGWSTQQTDDYFTAASLL